MSKESKEKNKLRKKIAVSALSLAAVLTLVGVGISKADFNGKGGPDNSLIQALVEKFNLNQSDVEDVFNQHQEEMRKEGQARSEERLNQAVTDGKLTEEQKNLILQKREEMRNEDHEDISNLSFEERRQLREEHREEMENWAEDNGIDMGYLHFKMGPDHGDGGFGPRDGSGFNANNN